MIKAIYPRVFSGIFASNGKRDKGLRVFLAKIPNMR
jgi:hypothetical protein